MLSELVFLNPEHTLLLQETIHTYSTRAHFKMGVDSNSAWR